LTFVSIILNRPLSDVYCDTLKLYLLQQQNASLISNAHSN
jgi:hypothetical protein